jgi:deoxyribonuclease IV
MILGSHLSIAGGAHNALLAARDLGFHATALFVRNQRRWDAKPLTDTEIDAFRNTREQMGIRSVVAHGSYLINLAGQPDVRGKSLIALADELDRCEKLGIESYVIHPGSHADAQVGLALIADALNAAVTLPGPRILLETTAGAGNTLGATFEQLAELLGLLTPADRFGVCIDTAHIFAAGYDLRTQATCRAMLKQFNATVGIDRLGAIHLNDNCYPLGTHRDRHAHIGQGEIGLPAFEYLVNHRKLTRIPMILETPKGPDDDDRDWDRVNADTLRALVHPRTAR